MNQNCVNIAKLSQYSNFEAFNLSITASVVIKSIKHKNTDHVYFYFDLADKSGDICAVAYDEACEKFFDIIEENKTYMITGFSLDKSDRHYTSNEHPRELVLRDNSVVKLCGEISPVNWQIESLNYDYDMSLFNVVGMCVGVSETKETPNSKLVRRVHLVDKDGYKGTLSVWNEETFLFDDLDLNSHPVLLAIDARTYEYQGVTTLTTSRFIKLLDPSHPLARSVRDSQAKYYTFSN